ncbi:MAG: RNA polymerase factor sigma-54 [Bacteroidetes bacterium]|nr:RNA polymerase factor sigma-54 [Bacteroidota bacterium]
MISQQQTQKQQLKILPQQIQLLNLYFLNTMELEQRIKNELDENPFLDTKAEEPQDELNEKPSKDKVKDFEDWDEHGFDDVPDYKTEYSNYFATEECPDRPMANYVDFKEEAKQQLRMLDLAEEDVTLCEYIIDILNNKGLMDRPLEEIADDYAFHTKSLVDVSTIKRGLSIVQTLDPTGLGACSIQECLLLQLKNMDATHHGVKNAIKLVEHHYQDLMHRQFEKIHHALNVNEEELKKILSLVGALNFHPVVENASGVEPKNTIIPDFVISRQGDKIAIDLYSGRSGNVFINQSLYDQLASQVSNKDKQANQYIKSKLQSAQWFVNAVKQREDTMMRIMRCIVQVQHEYFMDGDIHLLRPMVLRNISDLTGLDISTISRITSNKYADTHFGVIYLKDLFSEGIADKKGVVISNKVIQSVIEESISKEDRKHPYTDQQLVNILSSQGYNIARRTVAKYREQMQIPIAQIRAVWA